MTGTDHISTPPITVRLRHVTRYRFEQLAVLAPHEIRLRPAPHRHTPVLNFAMRIAPADAKVRWHHDSHDNWFARVVFPSLADLLEIEVEMDVLLERVNPFDFYVEPWALEYPFEYEASIARELASYRALDPTSARLTAFVEELRGDLHGRPTVDALMAANRIAFERIRYLTRDEQGVLEPDETLSRGCGSCRDSAWLLVRALRHLGFAARFTSGYLVQLKRDDGRPSQDTLALHAWCEAYVPGGGWLGLDATSGLVTAEGHIPLASVVLPANAAPVSGAFTGPKPSLSFEMSVERG
jgi:transglutaminase-like putative cysteine protease